jgi:chemotaxis protein histidine kinase CheA
MTNIKKQLFFLFAVFSFTNIFADERAPRSQCYINGGWALENTLESKIRELDVRLESLELYIRSDKKIYLTLGKVDRDEYRSYRNELGPAYSCSSGKGYLKRVSVDNNFKIANSLETNGRLIKGYSELSLLLSPTLSSQLAAEEQKIEKEKIEKAKLEKIQQQAIQLELEKQERENIATKATPNPSNISKEKEIKSSKPNTDESSSNIFVLLVIGIFFISWIYIKIKAANKKKKLAEQEAERKKKEDEAAKQFNETLKKFESDYPNIEYTKLEMECDKYLKTGLEEERSEILVNLKELEIKEIKQAEAEAERKKQAAEAAAERRKIEKAKLKKKLAEAEAEREKQAALALARHQEKIKLLSDKYGEKVAKAYNSKRVEIGMPISYVNDLKGSGHDRKRSVSKDGESIKEKYGKYFKQLAGGKKSSNPSYKMEIEYERSEDGSSWLVSSYKDY